MANPNQIFDGLEGRIKAALDRLPTLVGNAAVNFFQDSFQKQGWQGATFQAWMKRKRETRRSRGKPILIQSGRLRRSIRVTSQNANSVKVGTDVPYARIHNFGGEITQAPRSETFVRNRYKRGDLKGSFKKGVKPGKGFTYRERIINMPQRQFMGDSPLLREELKKVCVNEIVKALKRP